MRILSVSASRSCAIVFMFLNIKWSLDLGKSGSYMRSISIGKAMPSMHEFLRICEYLGVTPQEFFTGAGDETDRINIFNRLQDLDDGDIQKLQTFLGWMEEK